MNKLFEFDIEIVRHSETSAEESYSQECFGLCPQHDVVLIGTDEAGRGPGAGGVFASAVCFANGADKDLIKKLASLNDSKKLSKKKREELYDIILENTINSTVCIEVEEIEKINILNASLKAMKLACENVINEVKSKKEKVKRDVMLNSFQHRISGGSCERLCDPEINSGRRDILILVDGNKLIKDFIYPQKFIIKGDSKSASIAAASILAKVSRDRYMCELDAKFPQYNWKQNAGYLTAEHLSAIDKYGTTTHHRKSFLRKHEGKQCTLELNMCQK